MRSSTQRIWTLLLLAALAYGVAFAWGRGPGMMVFLGGGVIAELAFWLALFRRARRQ